MEKNLIVVNHENQTKMELPPGFRFHPTDEELITHYLSKKVLDTNFSCEAIGEVDMNKIEPWDLPLIAKLGECEWYFFSVKDRKYPNGLRTNRATAYGYWKATGKDKEIYKGKFLVGMKKTLVFYKGRAPNGVKSNWVTHEYRLEGNIFSENFRRPNRNDWVITKVFLKISGRQKVHISELRSMEWKMAESPPAPFQPTMDHSLVKSIESEVPQVNYVSKSIDIQQQTDQNMVTCLSSSIFEPSGSLDTMASQLQYHIVETDAGYTFSSMNPTEDPPIFKNPIENYGHNINHAIGNQREIVSTSREAAENTEKYTVVSNLDMEKRSLVAKEAPSTPIRLEDLDLILDIENYFY